MTEQVAGGIAPKVQKKRHSRGVLVPAMELVAEHGWEVGDRIMCDASRAKLVVRARMLEK